MVTQEAVKLALPLAAGTAATAITISEGEAFGITALHAWEGVSRTQIVAVDLCASPTRAATTMETRARRLRRVTEAG